MHARFELSRRMKTPARMPTSPARRPIPHPGRRPAPIFTNKANLRPHGPAGKPHIYARFEFPPNKKTSARMPTQPARSSLPAQTRSAASADFTNEANLRPYGPAGECRRTVNACAVRAPLNKKRRHECRRSRPEGPVHITYL